MNEQTPIAPANAPYSSLEAILPERVRRLGVEFLWIAVGQGMAALGGIIGVRVLTGLLEPAVYGQLALALTLVTLVQTTLLSPLGATFTRYFAPARETQRLPGLLRGARRLLVYATALVLAAAALLALVLLARGQIAWMGLAIAATAFALLSGYSIAMDGMQNAARQRVIVAWHRGLRVWLQLLLAIVAIRLLGDTSNAAMWGYTLAALLVFGSQYLFFRLKIVSQSRAQPRTSSTETAVLLQQMRVYAWPLVTWGVFIWMRTAADRWALQVFGTAADVGLYEALFQLGFYPLFISLQLVTQLITPVQFEIAGSGVDASRMQQARRLNQGTLLFALAATSLAALGALVLHEQLFDLLVAPAYRSVSYLLPWVILSAGLYTASGIAAHLAVICFDTRSLMPSQITTGLVALGAAFAGAYLAGIPGVIFGGLAVGIIRLGWMSRVGNQVFTAHLGEPTA